VTDDVFERRVRRFEEALEFLEHLAGTPWERFAAEPEKYASAERFGLLDQFPGTERTSCFEHRVAAHVELGSIPNKRILDVVDSVAQCGLSRLATD
jgi:hypothetical protein